MRAEGREIKSPYVYVANQGPKRDVPPDSAHRFEHLSRVYRPSVKLATGKDENMCMLRAISERFGPPMHPSLRASVHRRPNRKARPRECTEPGQAKPGIAI